MSQKFYTLAVKLCNEETLHFKNLTTEQEAEARRKIWTEGLRRKTNLNTFELISPFIIKSAYMIEQEGWISE